MNRLDVIAPSRNALVSMYQDINCVSGSVFINDELHDAFVSMSGRLIGPIGAGRYSLDPGFSPFFSRLRTIATGGRKPINVSVFYVRKSRSILPWSTGEFVYQEQVVTGQMPVRAGAGGYITVRVSDSRQFLTALIGLREFDEDETDSVVNALVIPHIRSAIAELLSQQSISTIQGHLVQLGTELQQNMAGEFQEIGILLLSVSVNGINIHQEDLARLQELNNKRISAAVELEAERNRLNNIYGGDVFNRTAAEATLAFANNEGMMGSPISQLAMLPALMGATSQWGEEMRRTMERMMPHQNGSESETSSRTPRESAAVVCPGCRRTIHAPNRFCPYCGHELNR